MATGVADSEIQAFYDFLGNRISSDPVITPEESVREFRAYQQELKRAQSELQASHDEYLQGKAKPLDVDSLMNRVRSRLADAGAAK
jgi:hypothetical protein